MRAITRIGPVHFGHTNDPLRSVWIPQSASTTAWIWLACQPKASGTHLAPGGAEGPSEAANRGRLWLNDGSCVRLRPTHRNHVWSYDFVMDSTEDGQPIKILILIDEYTRQCLTLF